jgi:hypothetical protein
VTAALASPSCQNESQPFLPYRIPQHDKSFVNASQISPNQKPAITEISGQNEIYNWVLGRMFPFAFAPLIRIPDRSPPTITQRFCTYDNKWILSRHTIANYKDLYHPHITEIRWCGENKDYWTKFADYRILMPDKGMFSRFPF